MTSDVPLAILRAAFSPRPIDVGDALQKQGRSYDGYDGDELLRHMHGRAWTELDQAFFLQRHSALSFLEPEYVAVLLPAYLSYLLLDVHAPSSVTVLAMLTPRDRKVEAHRRYGAGKRSFETLLDSLDDLQRHAIARVLACTVELHPEAYELPSAALERHWYRYLSDEEQAPARSVVLQQTRAWWQED